MVGKKQIDSKISRVIQMVRDDYSRKQVAKDLDISIWEARKLITQAKTLMSEAPKIGINPKDPLFRSEVVRLLKKPTTITKISQTLHSSEEEVINVIEDLEERGYIIQRRGTTISLGKTPQPNANFINFDHHYYGDEVKFGVVADMHLCSKAERLDVLNAAYDEFAKQGINTVLCPGNYVDGECRFNVHELKAHGIADQCQYAIDYWPRRDGIKTYYVDGDDHEGWWHQREGIEFGRYLMLESQAQGRDDLVYMGYMESDIELKTPQGSTTIKVIHAGGGSAYAYSYSSQKLAESFSGGEKPSIAIIGHYHKQEYCVSLDSEILTRSGWKKYNELFVGEEVLGYNLETGMSEWTTLRKINITPPTTLNFYSNAKFAINCTPDHQWVWEQNGERFLAALDKVSPKQNNSRPLLIQAARAPDGPGLGQLNHQDLLNRDLSVLSVLKMTSAERQSFLLGLMAGEGSRAHQTISFAQNDGPVNDAFTLAAFLEGRATGKPYKISDSDTLRTSLFQTPYRDYRIKNAIDKTTTEQTWCPTTGLGTWVMRQNGQITITGNCFPRNIHCVQPGTCQAQTMFMRKRKIAAHVGFSIIRFWQDIKGSVTKFVPEFYPFWDQNYYLNRDRIDKRLRS